MIYICSEHRKGGQTTITTHPKMPTLTQPLTFESALIVHPLTSSIFREKEVSILKYEKDSAIILPDIPLPPPSKAPTEVLSLDRDTPDHHVPRDRRLIRLTGIHPFNVEAPLTALFNDGELISECSCVEDGLLNILQAFLLALRFSMSEIMDRSQKSWITKFPTGS